MRRHEQFHDLPRQLRNDWKDRSAARSYDRDDWRHYAPIVHREEISGLAERLMTGPQPRTVEVASSASSGSDSTQSGADSWNGIRGIAGRNQRPTRFDDSEQDRSPPWADDGATEQDVRDALSVHPGVKDIGGIFVSARDGDVTLAGRVADRRQKRLAEDAALAVPGVRHVRNILHLGPPLPEDDGKIP